MGEKVVIFGTNEMAEMSHFYLTHDSPHKVVAFTVDRDFIKDVTLFGLPVVPFEEVESIFPPGDHKMIVATFFGRVNRTRSEKYLQAKAKGYELISYVSSKAVTWPGLVLGDNSFIFEGSIVNAFAKIGSDVVIAGSFVGHHSVVGDHCFLAAHAVVLGCATIEPYCFLGANSTIRENVRVSRECIIGAGALITKNTKEKGVYVTNMAESLPRTSDKLGAWLTWPAR